MISPISRHPPPYATGHACTNIQEGAFKEASAGLTTVLYECPQINPLARTSEAFQGSSGSIGTPQVHQAAYSGAYLCTALRPGAWGPHLAHTPTLELAASLLEPHLTRNPPPCPFPVPREARDVLPLKPPCSTSCGFRVPRQQSVLGIISIPVILFLPPLAHAAGKKKLKVAETAPGHAVTCAHHQRTRTAKQEKNLRNTGPKQYHQWPKLATATLAPLHFNHFTLFAIVWRPGHSQHPNTLCARLHPRCACVPARQSDGVCSPKVTMMSPRVMHTCHRRMRGRWSAKGISSGCMGKRDGMGWDGMGLHPAPVLASPEALRGACVLTYKQMQPHAGCATPVDAANSPTHDGAG